MSTWITTTNKILSATVVMNVLGSLCFHFPLQIRLMLNPNKDISWWYFECQARSSRTVNSHNSYWTCVTRSYIETDRFPLYTREFMYANANSKINDYLHLFIEYPTIPCLCSFDDLECDLFSYFKAWCLCTLSKQIPCSQISCLVLMYIMIFMSA